MRQKFKMSTLVMTAVLITAALSAKGSAQGSGHPSGVRNIVLVHGAFADGSSWSKVIPFYRQGDLPSGRSKIRSSHVVMLSRPQQVAAFIANAASSL